MERRCPRCSMILADEDVKRCPRCNAVLDIPRSCDECKGCGIKKCIAIDK